MRRSETPTTRAIGLTTLSTLVALAAVVAGADLRGFAPPADQTTVVRTDGHRVRTVAAVVAAAARHLLGTGSTKHSAPALTEACRRGFDPRWTPSTTSPPEPAVALDAPLLAERLLDLPPPARA